MAIIGHEGLPRSGKSYSAVKDWIIPQIKAGRVVWAYVKGLDHVKIAELAEVSEEYCREKLIVVSRDDVKAAVSSGLLTSIPKNSFVVLDEIQYFWPKSRKELPDDVMLFVKEHGHMGLDILIMDQNLKDVHKTWYNRIDTLYRFTKMDVVGKPDSYSFTVLKNDSTGKFQKTTHGEGKYESKYFGAYSSHEPGAVSMALNDPRANIWNNPKLAFVRRFWWLPLIFLAYLIYLFGWGMESDAKKVEDRVKKDKELAAAVLEKSRASPPVSAPPPESRPQTSAPPADSGISLPRLPGDDKSGTFFRSVNMLVQDPVADVFNRGRLRLSSVFGSSGSVNGVVQVWDATKVIDTWSFSSLRALGWFVFVAPDYSLVLLRKGDVQYVANAWLVDKSTASTPGAASAVSSPRTDSPVSGGGSSAECWDRAYHCGVWKSGSGGVTVGGGQGQGGLSRVSQ